MAFSNELLARRLVAAAGAVVFSACATTPGAGRTGEPLPLLVSRGGDDLAVSRLAQGHDAVLLVWWSTTCPCARRYEGRVQALKEKYGDRLVVRAVVAGADETIDKAEAERAARHFDVPLLLDPGARLATSLGVRSTPTAVVFDRTGAVVFRGWLDNERLPGESDREAYVETVLDAVLSGRGDHPKKSPTWGCPITRSLSEPLPDCCRTAQ